MNKMLVNEFEVKELINKGKLQEALGNILDVLDCETMDRYGITTGEIIKDTFEDAELIEDEGSITSFDQLDNNKFYNVVEEGFLNEGIIIYEINEDLLNCLLESVA
jgi:hypothetical protein